MTIKDYILQKLMAFGVTEAQLLDMSIQGGIDLEAEYTFEVSEQVGRQIAGVVCEMILAPKQKSINENGFSVSWDMDNLCKYYLWLCRKYGVDIDEDVTGLLGVSSIKDRTDIW